MSSAFKDAVRHQNYTISEPTECRKSRNQVRDLVVIGWIRLCNQLIAAMLGPGRQHLDGGLLLDETFPQSPRSWSFQKL